MHVLFLGRVSVNFRFQKFCGFCLIKKIWNWFFFSIFFSKYFCCCYNVMIHVLLLTLVLCGSVSWSYCREFDFFFFLGKRLKNFIKKKSSTEVPWFIAFDPEISIEIYHMETDENGSAAFCASRSTRHVCTWVFALWVVSTPTWSSRDAIISRWPAEGRLSSEALSPVQKHLTEHSSYSRWNWKSKIYQWTRSYFFMKRKKLSHYSK